MSTNTLDESPDINKKKDEYETDRRRKIILERKIHLQKNGKNMSTNEWFECHRYIPRIV